MRRAARVFGCVGLTVLCWSTADAQRTPFPIGARFLPPAVVAPTVAPTAAPTVALPRWTARPTLDMVSVAGAPLAAAAAPITRPDLEPGRVVGELVVGSYAGITGFFLGHYVGQVVTSWVADPEDATRSRIAFVTGVAGAWVGTTAGVFAIGSIGNQTGSLGTTAFGAGIGAVAGAVLDRLVFAPRSGNPTAGASAVRWAETVVESFLPSIGATIAFNSSRKYK